MTGAGRGTDGLPSWAERTAAAADRRRSSARTRCPSGWSGSRPTSTSGRISGAAPERHPRGRHQGRAQGPGAGRRRHRLRRRAAPRQRHRLLPGPHARASRSRTPPRPSTTTTTTPTSATRCPARRRHGAARPGRRLRASPPATPTGRSSSRSPGRSRSSRRRPQRGVRRPGDLVLAFARVLNAEAQALAAAGAAVLQIDEPFLAGYPEDVGLAVEADQHRLRRRRPVTLGAARLLRQPLRPAVWEGHYDFLFPAVLDAQVDQLVLEFARKGYDDLELFAQVRLGPHARPGRDRRQEPPRSRPPEVVASRIHRAWRSCRPSGS